MINRREYNDSAWKLLSDNRASYFHQSAQTKGGKVAPYQHKAYERERQQLLAGSPIQAYEEIQ